MGCQISTDVCFFPFLHMFYPSCYPLCGTCFSEKDGLPYGVPFLCKCFHSIPSYVFRTFVLWSRCSDFLRSSYVMSFGLLPRYQLSAAALSWRPLKIFLIEPNRPVTSFNQVPRKSLIVTFLQYICCVENKYRDVRFHSTINLPVQEDWMRRIWQISSKTTVKAKVMHGRKHAFLAIVFCLSGHARHHCGWCMHMDRARSGIRMSVSPRRHWKTRSILQVRFWDIQESTSSSANPYAKNQQRVKKLGVFENDTTA